MRVTVEDAKKMLEKNEDLILVQVTFIDGSKLFFTDYKDIMKNSAVIFNIEDNTEIRIIKDYAIDMDFEDE